MEEIDGLEATKAEFEHQRRRYALARREVIKLGYVDESIASRFKRIDEAIKRLTDELLEQEAALEPLRESEPLNYVSGLLELNDQSSKRLAPLTDELRQLIHEEQLRRASRFLT